MGILNIIFVIIALAGFDHLLRKEKSFVSKFSDKLKDKNESNSEFTSRQRKMRGEEN